jgi:small conductance mechanosensitive channel
MISLSFLTVVQDSFSLDLFYSGILIFIILFLTYVIGGVVKIVMRNVIRESSKIMGVEYDRYSFLSHFIVGFIYLLGFFVAVYTIPALRTAAVSMLAGAGVLALILGFAAQQAFSNIVSGVFLAIFKPISVGDRVKIGALVGGVVEDITLRHTVIRTFENKRLIIPNSKLSEEVIENANYGDNKVCRFIEIGVSYDSNLDLAMKIIREEAEAHPLLYDNRTKKEKDAEDSVVEVRVIGFSDSSVNLKGWAWTKTPEDAFKMGCDLNKSIKERFDREGIEIPFPYRTVVYKNDINVSKQKTLRGIKISKNAIDKE